LNITTSSKCLEKVVLPQTKALNIISLKNLQINQKENNNKYMSQSPKIKDLKLVQTPSNNNIMKIVKNIPQSTKTNEVKIAFDPTKTSYNSTIKGVNNTTNCASNPVTNKSPPKEVYGKVYQSSQEKKKV
jgi:hypothetical protein